MSSILSPSAVTAWLSCPHYLTLRLAGASGDGGSSGSSFADILRRRGGEHEANALRSLRASGREVLDCTDTSLDLDARIAKHSKPETLEAEVVYQMPFAHDGMRGIADFIIKHEGGHLPVDTKLARNDAKPGHVLQLCFYAEAIAELTGRTPTHIEIWLGGVEDDGTPKVEKHRLDEVLPYWRKIRGSLREAVLEPAMTTPVPCDHCSFCEYSALCESEWRQKDSIHFVSGVTKRDQDKLSDEGITTRAALAASTLVEVRGLNSDRLVKIRKQASLQVSARPDLTKDFAPNSTLPVSLLTLVPDAPWSTGLGSLPQPDDGDLFLDYEGHPFWTVEEGLIFLFGLYLYDGSSWVYEARWAHSKGDESLASMKLVDWIRQRRQKHPLMHVYHYNHTERSTLSSLVGEGNPVSEVLADLITDGVFVDLYRVVKEALQVGVESYGLKNIELVAGYNRHTDADSMNRGADAVVAYEEWMTSSDSSTKAALLDGIAEYNRHDVASTKHVRDWLISLRAKAGVDSWPPPPVLPEPDAIDPLEASMLSYPEGTPQHLLGHLLGYWRREKNAELAGLHVLLGREQFEIMEGDDALGGIEITSRTVDESGKVSLAISWPDQPTFPEMTDKGTSVAFLDDLGDLRYSNVSNWDLVNRRALLELWGIKDKDTGTTTYPNPVAIRALAPSESFPFEKRLDQLRTIAASWASGGAGPSKLSQTLLGSIALSLPEHLQHDVHDTDQLVSNWASYIAELDGVVIPVQGPPGTGKTYTAARLIKELTDFSSSINIGVASTSHAAVDNLLEETKFVIGEQNWSRLGRLGVKPVPADLNNRKWGGQGKRQVVFGTVAYFCNNDTADRMFDVVFIDEAGQMSLADALAISGRARNLVLLGDPQQLPQVSQASHQAGAGLSVLEFVLDGAPTIPRDRGLFLSRSFRMHPSICSHISGWLYEGRLTSHGSCDKLSTTVDSLTSSGTGLRVKLMNHKGNKSGSPEEVDEVIRIIENALGKTWTDREGASHEIDSGDILVVSPYNRQRRLVREALEARGANMKDVRVGTVDKFQGQEAAIVIFSMAASSTEDVRRGSEFLFDRNRLNVALSRAKCLAYVVCNEPLLTSRPKSIEQMKLISGLCSFAEQAVPI